jgi:ankyrin repeat protein
MSSSINIHRASQEGTQVPVSSIERPWLNTIASYPGQIGLVKSLLSQDAKLVNSRDAVSRLVNCITTIGYSSKSLQHTQDNRTPLHWAAGGESLAILQLLLTYEPELDAKDASGWTPLMIAGEYAGAWSEIQD